MKLLFVENQPESVEPVKRMLEKEYPDIECEIKGFAEAKDWISQHYPDIVSLDLLIGELSGEPEVAGQEVFDSIWRERFCPIIVYSAHPDRGAESRPTHPFVKSITKGKDSPKEFAAAIDEFRPHVDAIREAEGKIRKEFAFALGSRSLRVSRFPHCAAARAARQHDSKVWPTPPCTLMDDLSRYGGEECLASWEQYLCPPVSGDVQLGDILRRKDGPVEDPSSFYVVLTPSCDLVASGGRRPKVNSVLVASCCSMRDALTRVSMPLGKNLARDAEKLENFRIQLKKTILTQGYYQGIVPFPQLEGRIPTLAADLRKLRLHSNREHPLCGIRVPPNCIHRQSVSRIGVVGLLAHRLPAGVARSRLRFLG